MDRRASGYAVVPKRKQLPAGLLTKPKAKRANGMRAEYHFDYTKAKPNRFAQPSRRAPTSG